MDLHKLYLSEQLEGIKSGKFSSTELTTHYLERISKFDEDLNSFITVTEDSSVTVMNEFKSSSNFEILSR